MAMMDGDDDPFIFDPTLLTSNDIPENEALSFRPLKLSDYHKGYLQLLQQLTVVGDVDFDVFKNRFMEMKRAATYFIMVIEDVKNELIVGSTTLFLEFKFIHSCALRARIEDVIVNKDLRGTGVGKFLVQSGIRLAKELGCYKLSLDCRDAVIPFYTSLGFVKEVCASNMLVIRIP